MMAKVKEFDAEMLGLYNKGKSRKVVKGITRFSVDNAQKQFLHWVGLEEMLTVKFIDGNVKAQDAEGRFLHSKYHEGTPEGLTQPGYTERWKAAVAHDHGDVLEVK